ncbi:MAG: aminotransferase class IV, partial [Pseudobdellovibrionaceae bacterium]
FRPYLLTEHLARLEKSAAMIGLKLPKTRSEIAELIHEACVLSELKDGMIRLFISRGPGDFSTNPYATVGSQIYLVVTHFTPLDEIKYLEGVSVLKSRIPQKASFFATIKSCNYLPNVLMKKEAIDLKCDFAIGVDERGFLLESSTENIGLVDEDNFLVHPPLD